MKDPMDAERDLCAFLSECGVDFEIHRHPPLFTVEQSKAHTAHLPGAHTKNLFLKEKKGGFVLATCLEDRRIKIKHLEKAIGAKRLSFGSAEALGEVLGVIPGAVTPFALFNDRAAMRVRMIVDSRMMSISPQNFHPLHNEATVAVSPDGLRAFFGATGHAAEEVDFDALEALSEDENAV